MLTVPRLCVSRAFAALSLMVLGLLLVPPYTLASAPNSHVPSGSDYGGGDWNHQLLSGQSVSIHCQGAITATFTWNGGPNNDPAPAANSVIVVEQVNADWSGQSGSVGSDIAGGTTTGTAVSQTYTATRYSVQGGSSISVTCTPTASASSTAPVGGESGALADVGYTAAVYPVTINPNGTTLVSGQMEALTGQQITATLSAPFQIDPNSYSWLVSGSMFKNYDWTLTSNQKTDLSDADYFRSAFIFYDATAETLLLSCSATVICPDGSRLNVTAQRSVKIVKPTETAWTISAANVPNGPFFYDYDANGNFNPQYGVQTTWNPITMTVPAPFTGGQVCLAQIGNFNRVDTRVAVNGASNTYIVTPAMQGLDTGFPYLIAYQVNGQGNIIIQNNGSYAPLSPPEWSIIGSGPTRGAGGDRPDIPCEPALVNRDTGGDNWRNSTDTDTFDTWTMFRPPAVSGQPTVWVPVQTIHWVWSGSANVHTDAGGHVILDANGNAQWYFTIPQVNPAGNPTNTTLFPTWSTVIPFGLTMGPPVAH